MATSDFYELDYGRINHARHDIQQWLQYLRSGVERGERDMKKPLPNGRTLTEEMEKGIKVLEILQYASEQITKKLEDIRIYDVLTSVKKQVANAEKLRADGIRDRIIMRSGNDSEELKFEFTALKRAYWKQIENAIVTRKAEIETAPLEKGRIYQLYSPTAEQLKEEIEFLEKSKESYLGVAIVGNEADIELKVEREAQLRYHKEYLQNIQEKEVVHQSPDLR